MSALDRSTARPGRLVGRVVTYTALIVLGVVMLMPFWWAVVTAVEPPAKAFGLPPTWVPTAVSLDSFRQVFDLLPFARQFFNSVKITSIVVLGSLVVSCSAAYAFARLSFPGRDIIFVVFLAALMIPTQVTVIPTYILMRYAGLLDTHTSLWLPGLIQVFSIFMLRQHFLSIPRELEEAAVIDGATRLGILSRIFLPMSAPVIAALAIFTAERYWNDFFNPNIFLTSPEKMTIPVGLVSLQNQYGTAPTTVVFAGIALVVVPIFVLFLFAQRRLTEGISLAGVAR